ncbi:pyridoxamine 5'-phosphate oxidase family protein [Shimia litoralis]|uniref:Pyridoxamine 5'-phosphate oxidase family protein n=1 Tax=Shimia litoralis TaxID=420403 RepID=A0A4U7N8V2_9RHOB|nr:pyridoxamine 5'-phosphate oxidase family protein [Shimia litoralis]TKZ22415.1 pyridoxamine 5'-phosphate oxidase family protein [Shimia litoralis]
MQYITDISELEDIYGTPAPASLRKVAGYLTPEYRRWIMASRFCVVSTVGPDGTDGSPRGDDGPVVQALDDHTLAMPDWRGNNRMDTLRNIVLDDRISLMFMVAGSTNVVRVNGRARITADADMCARFEVKGKHPRSVVVIKITEVYFQCARAIMRAQIWDGEDQSAGLPTAGDILAAMTDHQEGGAFYDDAWQARAAETMW